MDKEQFSKLLLEQKEKGRALISLISTMHESQNDFGDGMVLVVGEDLYYVPEDELYDFINKFEGWKSYVYELLEAQFGSNCKYAYEWNTYVITHVSKREPILKQLTRNVNKALSLIDSFLERIDLYMGTKHTTQLNDEVAKNKRVFIVHGHDSNTRNEAELLVKQLGYEPVVLFKQPNMGDTIIEKLLRESSEAAFAIVLYTKCDEGKAVEEAGLKPRARQNVVFEHGLMCGLLGRKHVVALVEEGVEIPGDLSGIVYIALDSAKRWQFDVAREMKASGLAVDLNKLM